MSVATKCPVETLLSELRNAPQADIAAPMSQAEFEHILNDSMLSDTSRTEIVEALESGKIKSFNECPPDLIQSLNRYSFGYTNPAGEVLCKPAVKVFQGFFPIQDIYAWSGLEVAEPVRVQATDVDGEPVTDDAGNPVFVDDKDSVLDYSFSIKPGRKEPVIRYRTIHQRDNRPLDVDKSKGLSVTFAAGKWAGNGETFIFDSLANGASCQHRTVAIKFAEVIDNLTDDVPLIVVVGIPALMVNTIDTGRSRAPADILYRDRTVLPESTLTRPDGQELTPNEAKEVRNKVTKDLSSVATLLNYRLHGKNVNASFGKVDSSSKNGTIMRIIRSFDGLEQLCVDVWNSDNAAGGKIGRLLPRQMLVGAIALHYASTQADEYVEPDTLQAGQFTIDREETLGFIRAIETAWGANAPVGDVLSDWKRKIPTDNNGRYKDNYTNIEKFAVVCNFVSQYYREAPLCRLRSEGSPFAHSNVFTKKDKAAGTEVAYPNFGGVDTPAGLRK